jgi:hypothetical protein
MSVSIPHAIISERPPFDIDSQAICKKKMVKLTENIIHHRMIDAMTMMTDDHVTKENLASPILK